MILEVYIFNENKRNFYIQGPWPKGRIYMLLLEYHKIILILSVFFPQCTCQRRWILNLKRISWSLECGLNSDTKTNQTIFAQAHLFMTLLIKLFAWTIRKLTGLTCFLYKYLEEKIFSSKIYQVILQFTALEYDKYHFFFTFLV